MTALADASDRELAATTFDRNIAVTAGAGTGKTTLLVDRLVHLLIREPEPLKITEIVALTFTNKAASEMKLRLRERLQGYLDARLDLEPGDEKTQKIQLEIRSLLQRYRLTKAQIDARTTEALRQIERSEIGTIHSFAATLLRLYPMETGLDPQFREDDGRRFERHFEESWAIWLDQELSARAGRKEEWKRVLRKISLEELRDLAFSLCSENVPLHRLVQLSREEEIPEPVTFWLRDLDARASALLLRHGEEGRNEEAVRASMVLIEKFLREGEIRDGDLEEEKSLLSTRLNNQAKDWNNDDIRQARELARVARDLCRVDRSLIRLLSDLVVSFALGCRERFIEQGFVSFDGLLARARDLLRDHPGAREELKRHFKAILIDEFQDTDPIQYEILLYLAERTGEQAPSWRDVRLEPGKIFIVGDPKQSIYAFRRADIEAYLNVVQDVIKKQNGIECWLTANFRSHAGILSVVNGVFERLMQPREALQPSYVAVHPADPEEPPQTPSTLRGVEVRCIEAEDGQMDAEKARQLEAEALARWLDEEVIARAEILDRERQRRVARAGDVAILLRRLTDVHDYLEPLRRRGIRYVVEGERHFYAVQEVIDAINLVRAVDNPYDRSALVGILRSPAGGLKDKEIFDLHREGLLDYRAAARPKTGASKAFDRVRALYEILCRLHDETRRLPVGEALSLIFASIPLRLLAARSFHGEQAVANLDKVREQAEMMGREGMATFKEVIAMLQRRVLEVKEEGQSALAEENIEAVRVLSIHKAKGLEFPIVILAGCHSRPDLRRGKRSDVQHDWSTGLVGLRAGRYGSLAGLYMAERARLREEEEQKRVLYVAMTRAREHLLISGAPSGRVSRGSFLSLLEEALGALPQGSGEILAGRGRIKFQALKEKLSPPRPPKARLRSAATVDWESYVSTWRRRKEEYEAALKSPFFVTPTMLKEQERELTGRVNRKRSTPDALLIGELAHRFLQKWDFRSSPEKWRQQLRDSLEVPFATLAEVARERIQRELEEIFSCFLPSPAYAELSSSRILGREVPLLLSRNGEIWEGAIDVVYEREGEIYLADYKTDRVSKEDLRGALREYRHQIRIYSDAARSSLKREIAGFKLIFLRLGEALEAIG